MTISTTTLKNAARAIECDLWTDSDGANYLAKDGAILRRWEPLVDDGDALRLAVKLGMWVTIFKRSDPPATMVGYSTGPMHGANIEYNHADSDEFSATRMAIVFAASEIGAAPCQ